MSDTDRFGTEVATRKERIEGTWEFDGETYDLITEDTTKGTLSLIEEYGRVAERAAQAEDPEDLPDDLGEDIDDFPWESEDDEDIDWLESVIREKLIKPEVDVDKTPLRKLRALYEGMMDAWGEGETVAAAKADMPLDEGNS